MNYPITLKDGEEWPIQWIEEIFTEAELAAGEKRFDMVPIGYCGVKSVSGMAFEPIYGSKQPWQSGDPIVAWRVWGLRTMSLPTQLGYELEGKVSIQGKKRRAFTSSQLLAYTDNQGNKHLFNCAILYICK